MERIALSSSLGRLLEWCMTQSATDLHAQADRRYSYRVDGKLERIPAEQFPVPTSDDIVKMLQELFADSVCWLYESLPSRIPSSTFPRESMPV